MVQQCASVRGGIWCVFWGVGAAVVRHMVLGHVEQAVDVD
jgi:hypothetical protein